MAPILDEKSTLQPRHYETSNLSQPPDHHFSSVMSSVTPGLPPTILPTLPLFPDTTTTERPALTTPFVPSSSCRPIQDLTSITETWIRGPNTTTTTTTIPVIMSDPADPSFAGCQPSGWDPGTGLSFSPGVCPSGWAAFSIVASHPSLQPFASTSTTTAFCCTE